MTAYGSPGNPVQLDPFQMIKSVHWTETEGSLLYFQGLMFSEQLFSVHNWVEFQFILTVPGVGTYTFDRSTTPLTVTYNGQNIARDDYDGSGVGTLQNPSDPRQITCGEWMVVKLEQLRLAYPSFTTLTVEIKAVGSRSGGASTVNPNIGARAHLVSGTPIFFDDTTPEPSNWFPYQLSPAPSPDHDPDMDILQSEVVNKSSGAFSVFETGFDTYDWSALVAAMQTIATFSYDDTDGTMTVG